ncbi:PLP-dependent aminotransferase family protein [Pseudophaeobacter sp. A-200-2]|uniref:MocR-like pyridoxine biosynthesis transcription factor PdxR n=1 Tax=Pseudophaeobacter sp. A-200-2 TaxID=3098145 RepID=UPI0034D6D468
MQQVPGPTFSIDRSLSVPVFEQICTALRTRIGAGEIPEASQLPATRSFAVELGVSRSTVVAAYEQLEAEGYIAGKRGSGFTVCAMGQVELQPVHPAPPEHAKETPRALLPFNSGEPDMRLFPHRQWARCVSRICRVAPETMLDGGAVRGNAALRRSIAAYVAEWRGIEAGAEQIIITAGATDALELCLRTLAPRGSAIGIEDPGYPSLNRIVQSQGLRSHYLRVDALGACVPEKDADLKAVVLTPSHQHPLGGAMAPGRRLEFLNWAKRTGAWIIEDDYDSEFRYAGRPIPAMAGFDGLNRTIYLGSFSKTFSNALRIGYVVAPETLIAPLHDSLLRFGTRASGMPQQALAEFIDSGEFYRHLRRVRRIYGERRKHLLARLQQEFSAYGSAPDHGAGMQLVFYLNDAWQDQEICKRARDAGLGLRPLSGFAAEVIGLNGLVLGCCHMEIPEIDAALTRLAQVFDGEAEPKQDQT